MKNTISRYGVWAMAAALLAACQSVPLTPSTWQAGEREALNFTAAGRLAVKQNDKGSYANFDWDSNGKRQILSVNTPLGNSVGELCQDAQGVTAVAANGDTYRADNAEQLSRQLMGFAIPVGSLDLWAHGFWDDSRAHAVRQDGRLQQDGWLIERQTAADGSPRLLVLSNTDLSIRLVFNDYQRGAADAAPACDQHLPTSS